MGKRKITCNNSSCKHHTNGGCDTCITLDGSGKCKSFEKGFTYYFHIVWDALDNKSIVNILKAAVKEIYTGGLVKVTLNLRGGVKASISQNSKGEINVERTETKKQKLTE